MAQGPDADWAPMFFSNQKQRMDRIVESAAPSTENTIGCAWPFAPARCWWFQNQDLRQPSMSQRPRGLLPGVDAAVDVAGCCDGGGLRGLPPHGGALPD